MANAQEYLEKELKDLKLDMDQKQMLREALSGEGDYRENISKVLSTLQKDGVGNRYD
jgi:hypothetical protein